MLNLLIVEDEVNTLTELTTFIQWTEIGFSVKGAFTSAVEALDYLKTQPVDVLLTDVMMPNMSGIELIAEVRKLNLPVECVILSAYNDFSFAQAAIRYSVANYVLKPFDPDELSTLFASLHDRIIDEKQKKETQLRTKRVIELSRTELVEKAVENYLRGIFWQEDTITFLLTQYSCVRENDRFALALWSANKDELVEKKKILQEWCQNRLGRTGILFPYQGNNIWFLAIPPEISIEKILEEQCKHIQIRVLMTQIVSSLLECPKLFQELLSAKDQLFSMETEQFKQISNLSNGTNTMPGLLSFVAKFSSAIQNQNEPEFSSILCEFAGALCNVQVSRELAAISLTDLCHNVLKSIDPHNLKDVPNFHQIFIHLNELSSFSSQRDYVEVFLRVLFEQYSEKKDNSSLVAQKVRDHIDTHYSEALSVSVLAKRFYFSSNYLSGIFQQQFGCSIPVYIKQVRMKKAQELLVETNAYVQDIAVSVGMPNYRTFSQAFKDAFAMTPLEYRIYHRMKQLE